MAVDVQQRRSSIMRLVATIAVLLFPASVAAAQAVRGIVVDTAGKPVAGALILASNPERIVRAGRDGRFQLSREGTPICSFEVQQARYAVARIRLEMCPDTAIRVVLLPAAAPVARGDVRSRCATRTGEPCTAPDTRAFASISAGYTHTCALTGDGVAWCWGDGRKGALGGDAPGVQRWPLQVNTTLRFAEVGAGSDFTCARTGEGAVYCWGTERPVPGWPKTASEPVKVSTQIFAASLAVGRRHACVLDARGQASCWGWNVDGETGSGSAGIESAMISSPVLVAGQHTFRSLSAGAGFTCGVTTAGEVFCWGSNVDGAVGDKANDRCGDVGAVACSVTPVLVSLPGPATSVSAGGRHACAVTGDGAVHCWGANDVGQLGAREPRSKSPRRVDLGRDVRVRSVHSGGIHSCVITDREALYCWGADSKSLTDIAYWADELRPRVVADGTRFAAVSLGPSHLCGLDRAGRLLCWGDTMLGALGAR